MSISLIHIGMMKSASTSLQNVWRQNNSINLIYAGLLHLIDTTRMLGKGQPSQFATPDIKSDTPVQAGQKIILSHESLSTAYINERAELPLIKNYQRITANLLGKMIAPTKILIVTRDPLKWIISTYNQSVKQGGADTFPQFLLRERSFIIQSLNIADLFSFWKASFGTKNVLVLPMELLRDDKKEFHKLIHHFAHIPEPISQPPGRSNTSLTREDLNIMRAFNVYVEKFLRYGSAYNNHNITPNLQNSLNQVRFAVRYNLEQSNDRLRKVLRPTVRYAKDCNVDTKYIPNDLLKIIYENFDVFLKSSSFYSYRNLYTSQENRTL